MNNQRTEDELAVYEADKYKKMWALDAYHNNRSNVQQVRHFIARYNLSPTSVCDFGCGPGYACQEFSGRGFTVIAVDIADNCLSADEKAKYRFVLSSLWSLPSNVRADIGFCTDVMEHIPTEKVDAVLDQLSKSCRRGVFLDISLRKDGCGAMINDVLHLTVRPKEWWLAKLAKFWDIVEIDGYDDKRNSMTVAVWHADERPNIFNRTIGRLRIFGIRARLLWSYARTE